MNIIEKFKEGRKIHIKKANRGKFTEYCGGKVTSECIARGKNSSDPAVRKRATFAANARKWKHKKGGKAFVEGVSALDSNPKAYKRVKKMYKMRGYAGGGNFDWGSAIQGGVQLIGSGLQMRQQKDWEKEWNKYIESQQKAIEANALKTVSQEDLNAYAKDLSNRLTEQSGEVVNVSPIDVQQMLQKKKSEALSDARNYSQQWAAQKKLQLGLNNPSSRWTDLMSSVGNIATGLISQSTNKNNAPSATQTDSSKIQVPRLYDIDKNYMNSGMSFKPYTPSLTLPYSLTLKYNNGWQ